MTIHFKSYQKPICNIFGLFLSLDNEVFVQRLLELTYDKRFVCKSLISLDNAMQFRLDYLNLNFHCLSLDSLPLTPNNKRNSYVVFVHRRHLNFSFIFHHKMALPNFFCSVVMKYLCLLLKLMNYLPIFLFVITQVSIEEEVYFLLNETMRI